MSDADLECEIEEMKNIQALRTNQGETTIARTPFGHSNAAQLY